MATRSHPIRGASGLDSLRGAGLRGWSTLHATFPQTQSGNESAVTCTHVAAPRSRAKKNFCAVTFPKSIVLSCTAFPLVQTPIALFFFRASIPCSHRQTTALKRVRAAYQAAFKGGSSFYLPACVTDYTLWLRVFGPVPTELFTSISLRRGTPRILLLWLLSEC